MLVLEPNPSFPPTLQHFNTSPESILGLNQDLMKIRQTFETVPQLHVCTQKKKKRPNPALKRPLDLLPQQHLIQNIVCDTFFLSEGKALVKTTTKARCFGARFFIRIIAYTMQFSSGAELSILSPRPSIASERNERWHHGEECSIREFWTGADS